MVGPADVGEQTVPAQQVSSAGWQGSPAATHAEPVIDRSTAEQTSAPGVPTQDPTQQSSVAPQGAPSGMQALRQERAPVVSRMHRPPRH